MLSHELIRIIETHWETIADRMIAQAKLEPELEHIGALPDSELREWCKGLLTKLGESLAGKLERSALAAWYERAGRTRFEEGVPLYEGVKALFLVKEKMIDFVRDQGFGESSVEIFAEEELEHKLGRYFDTLVFFVVKGYETAFRARTGVALPRVPHVRMRTHMAS